MMMTGEREKMYEGTLDCWVKILKGDGSKAFSKAASRTCSDLSGECTLVLYDVLSITFIARK